MKATDVKPLYGIRDFLHQQSQSNLLCDDKVDDRLSCKFHTGAALTLWCTKCDVMICNVCFGENHDGHLVRSLRKYLEDRFKIKMAKSFPKGVDSYHQEAEAIIGQCDEKIKSLKSELKKWKECRETTLERKRIVDQWKPALSESLSFKNSDYNYVMLFLNQDFQLPKLPKQKSKQPTNVSSTGDFYQDIPLPSAPSIAEISSNSNQNGFVDSLVSSEMVATTVLSKPGQLVEGRINVLAKKSKAEAQQPNRFIFGNYVFRVGCSLQNDPPWIGEKLLIKVRASLLLAKKATSCDGNGSADVEVKLTNNIYPSKSFISDPVKWVYTENKDLEIFTLNYASLTNPKNMWLKAGDIFEVQIAFASSESCSGVQT